MSNAWEARVLKIMLLLENENYSLQNIWMNDRKDGMFLFVG